MVATATRVRYICRWSTGVGLLVSGVWGVFVALERGQQLMWSFAQAFETRFAQDATSSSSTASSPSRVIPTRIWLPS